MERLVRKLLVRWGSDIVLGQTHVRGILHHSGSKSFRNMERDFSPLGQIPDGQYVYIGPASPSPQLGQTLLQGAIAYEVRRVEQVRFGNAVLYTWGLCVRKDGGSDCAF